jgi:hypothetical protein
MHRRWSCCVPDASTASSEHLSGLPRTRAPLRRRSCQACRERERIE